MVFICQASGTPVIVYHAYFTPWSEQIPGEIVVKIVDKSCPSPLWWAAIRHSGRFSKDCLAPHLTNPGLQHASVRLLLVPGGIAGDRQR